MTNIDHLIRLVDAYCAATGRSEARLSDLIFNRGNRIKDIRAGSDLGTRTLEGALQWLSDNWPPDAKWPAAVPRPKRAKEPVQ